MQKLTWEDVETAIENLADKIKASSFSTDYIIGITTGGVIPMGLLAKELSVKNILTSTALSNNDNAPEKKAEILYIPQIDLSGKNVLLVDDVTERGSTLNEISNAIKRACKPNVLKTATLVADVNICKYMPDYFIFEQKTDWICFPWENEKFGSYIEYRNRF